MYSETGFEAQARTRLHGPVWPLQRRPDSTALVWFKDTSFSMASTMVSDLSASDW
jgi:hypothetical protein